MQPLPFALAILFALAAPLLAADAEVTPNANYVSTFIGDEAKGMQEITFIAGIHEISGRVAVCGFVINTARSGVMRQAERQIARQLRIFAGKQRLIVQTDNFKRIASLDAAQSAKAGCSVTRTPWQAAFATMRLTIPAGRVRYTD